MIMNGVLPAALASLGTKGGFSKEQLEEEVKGNAEKASRGEEVDNQRIKNLSRILRASAFFGDDTRRWQVGVTLVTASVVDRLHWQVLGARGKRFKANLEDMIDPHKSIVGAASAKLLSLLDG